MSKPKINPLMAASYKERLYEPLGKERRILLLIKSSGEYSRPSSRMMF